jgi:3-oxoacyl-[acyl-carrier protein] reductase
LDLGLNGKVALITGGSEGIGRATAVRMAAEGAKVVICARRPDVLASAARDIGDGTGADVTALQADVTDPAELEAVFDHAIATYGRIDILVNNAGIWNAEPRRFPELGDAELSRMLDVNLKGAMQVTRSAVVDMVENGWGRVVNVGSTAGVRGEAGHSHYAASKGALLAWSRSLTGELAPSGVTVNVVSPGWVFTDMTRDVLTSDYVARIESEIPTQRLTRPDDVAGAVLFLASDLAAQVSGVNLDINGGAVFS